MPSLLERIRRGRTADAAVRARRALDRARALGNRRSPAPARAPAARASVPASARASAAAASAGLGARISAWAGRGRFVLLRTAVKGLFVLALAVFAALLLRETFTPSPASVGLAHTQLRPGSSIRLYLHDPSWTQAAWEIGGNVLVGVPFGLLVPTLAPRLRGVVRIVGFTAGVVLLIELDQRLFIEGRSFDIDDILLAALGAVIGYLPLGRLLARWAHPAHRHWWQRLARRARSPLSRRTAGG